MHVRYCSICRRKSTDEKNPRVIFHRFPQDAQRSNQWAKIIGRQDILQKSVAARTSYVVCSRHFTPSMYPLQLTSRLKRSAFPTVDLEVVPYYNMSKYPIVISGSTPTTTNELMVIDAEDHIEGSVILKTGEADNTPFNSKVTPPEQVPKLVTLKDDSGIIFRITERIVNEVIIGEEPDEELYLAEPKTQCTPLDDHTYSQPIDYVLTHDHSYANLRQSPRQPSPPPLQLPPPPPLLHLSPPPSPPTRQPYTTTQTQTPMFFIYKMPQIWNLRYKMRAYRKEVERAHTKMLRLKENIFPITSGMALHEAVYSGDLDAVQSAVRDGSDVNRFDCYNNTPLMVAVRLGQVEIVEFLLKSGAKTTPMDKLSMTALAWTIRENNECIADLLLDKTLNPDAPTPDSILAFALKCGAKRIFDSVILKNPIDVNYVDCGKTLLGWAAVSGDIEATKTLISRGADVDLPSPDGNTPLATAIQHKQLQVAYYLRQICDISKVTTGGRTPLAWAVENEEEEMVMWLLDHGAQDFNSCLLSVAIRTKNLRLVKILMERGTQLSDCNRPLMKAIEADSFEIAKYLLEQGASVLEEFRARYKRTPLWLAIRNKDLKMIQLILEHGGTVMVNTVFLDAITTKSLDIVKLLTEKGAQITARKNSKTTPLKRAIQIGSVEIARYLLENGADITDISDSEGEYVKKFLESKDYEMLNLLRENGVQVDESDDTIIETLREEPELG